MSGHLKSNNCRDTTLAMLYGGGFSLPTQSIWNKILFFSISILVFQWLLSIWGLGWGEIPNAQYIVADVAYAQCLKNDGVGLAYSCANFGYPVGSPRPFGLPVAQLASFLTPANYDVSISTVSFVYVFFLLVAFVGSFFFFSTLSGRYWGGLIGACLYHFSPTVYGHLTYGALGLGVSLIPAYLYLGLLLIRSAQEKRLFVFSLLSLGMLCERVFSIFLDGYSFLFSVAAFLCVLTFVFFVRGWRRSASVVLLVWFFCNFVSYHLYKGQISDEALAAMPLDLYRGAGVDVLMLFMPPVNSMYNLLIGFGLEIPPSFTYTDSAGLRGLFLGYIPFLSLLSVAVFFVYLFVRKRGIRVRAAVCLSIIFSGCISLVVAMGPSLKFADYRDVPSASFNFKHYLMPESEATASMIYADLYPKIPGLKNSRVLSRWLVLTRLALSLSVILVFFYFWDKQGKARFFSFILLAISLFETLPDITRDSGGEVSYSHAYWMVNSLAREVDVNVDPGSRVYLLQLHDGRSDNEYSANIICAKARVHCYNAGGDKAGIIIKAGWPDEISTLRKSRSVSRSLGRALEAGLIDIVVIPKFDLRQVVYSRSAGMVDVFVVRDRSLSIAKKLGLEIYESDNYIYMRLGKERPDV